VSQRAVFLILFRLKLLQRIFFNLLLPRVDFELEFLAVGLQLSHAQLRRFERSLVIG
jgi:hypothetical protein